MERQQQVEVQQQVSMPMGLRYDLAVSDSVPANRNIAQFLASNASVFGVSNNTIRINVSSGSFLDLKNALLQYELKNTTSQTIQLDGGADCVINRIRVLSSDGSEIERIDSYNIIASILDQYTTNDSSLRVLSALKGSPSRLDDTPLFDEFTFSTTGTAYDSSGTSTGLNLKASATIGGDLSLKNDKGGRGYDHKQADKLATTVVRKYSFGLKLGLFNSLTSKLLPPNTPFQLEIQLENSGANCLVNVGANAVPTFTVENVELHIPAITINDPAFMARMDDLMNRGMSWKANTYQHFVNTTSSSGSKDNIQLGARARSLKGLITVLRQNNNITANQKFKISKRSIQYVSDYIYKIGPNNYPIDRVEIKTCDTGDANGTDSNVRLTGNPSLNNVNIAEAYAQMLRLSGNLNQSNPSCLIGPEAFGQSEVNNGCGVLAIDLSAYSDGSVNSGINTNNNMPVSIEISKLSTVIASQDLQLDTFSVNELVIMRMPNGVLASSY
jgi:hypothetical protein